MPGKIKIDDGFIKEVQATLKQLRAQITDVKSGVDPNDGKRARGGHLTNLTIAAGGDKFAEGANLKSKISSLATAADQKLSGFDQKFSGYDQGLSHIIASSDATEDANSSYASFGGYLTGSGAPPSLSPPPTH
ncbi:hypothetical protein HH310_29865 [Actinoplanes sp. TBRC 11911]|uniref:hypothetical protein n=1 Tax=Actinoplanes sp. TBRC 11911 TaxID=2729386 RepID=UPI00145E4907|nr:hypothetical protein [Actinoplanes sp. TBRC 11911]NMO55377.1 hypothetical protein [Actinoplanes sp. TBRC 11911]